MSKYTAEQVRACILAYKNGDLNYCRSGIVDLLTEHAAILDAEGDGGAVACGYLITWNDPTYRGRQTLSFDRCSSDDGSFEPVYTHHARSGVVRDEDVRDAARYRWLRENVQPFRNGNPSPHAIVKVSLGIGADQRERAFDLIDKAAHVGVVTLDQAIDAAIQGERHER